MQCSAPEDISGCLLVNPSPRPIGSDNVWPDNVEALNILLSELWDRYRRGKKYATIFD